jgi:hypothetical protein
MQKKDNHEKSAERDKQPETPFFARYLEGQKSLKVKTNLKAGATLKYPSDRDEWWD